MKIIDRYLTREMIAPFFIGVIGFIMVLTVDLLFTMADLIINKGIPFWAVLKLLFYKLPSLLVLTFPVSTLFGAAMAIGRLCQDNELTALRTSGITLFRIAAPLLIIGLLVSAVSFFTNEKIVPHANAVSDTIIRQIIYKQPLPEVRENVFFKDQQNRFYYAKRVNNAAKTMENVMIYELSDERFPRVVMAGSAAFSGKVWTLMNGIIHNFDEKGSLKYEANFSEMQINVAEEILNYSAQKDFNSMNTDELRTMIGSLKRSGAGTQQMLTELYLKYAIPLSCFVFALIGVPFSLSTPRAGRTWGIILTIVFMFTFYVFASVFRSLGRGGMLPPLLAAFTPQLTFIIIGLTALFYESEFH